MILMDSNTTGSITSLKERFSNPFYITDVVLAVALCIFSFVCVCLFFKRKASKIIFLIGLVIDIIAIILDLTYTSFAISCILIILGVTALFFNLGYIRNILQNPISNKKNSATKHSSKQTTIVSNTYDVNKFVKDVTTSVLKLSATKTGAIMTFEKKIPLDSYMKNGTIINCPFTPEIVETIFYVGTRLHDGAIIVRNNLIVAASVYYTPSTRALTGKFGARHRAALGISEATDSVTVICSEETGRISIAYNGKLEPVKRDEFSIIFKEYLDY